MPSQESGLITRTVPKVDGGVSQRSAVVRDTSQCTELINGFPDSTFGLSRRPSSVFNTAVQDFTGAHYLYTFAFSPTEKYALMVANGALKVVDLINKTEMDVTVAGGSETYLVSADPSKDFQAMTVGNDTFILNRSITVAQDESTFSDADTPAGLVWVRIGDFGTAYNLILDGTLYGYITNTTYRPDIDTAEIVFALTYAIPTGNAVTRMTVQGAFIAGDHITLTETTTGKTATIVVPTTGFQDPPGVISSNGLMLNIIGGYFYSDPPVSGNLHDLYAAIPGFTIFLAGSEIWAATGAHSGDNLNFTATTTSTTGSFLILENTGVKADTYNCSIAGASLTISRVDNADFTFASRDGLGDQAMEAFKGDLQTFSDLPVAAANGFKLHITGELLSEVDDFYVVMDTTNAPTNSGVWRESLKGGELTSLDETTMPHVLEPDGMGGWNFGPGTWTPRVVGDLVSNPMPSFVGKEIDDIFFFKNRLGFVAGESRVMSQSGQYFSFFRKSVSQLFDDERIDVASNSAAINHIHFATFQDNELILWGDKGQISVSGTPLLTPKTVSEEPAGAFLSSPDVKPVQSGKVSYFLTERNGTTQVSELFTNLTTLRANGSNGFKDVVDLTENVPTYIDKEPSLLDASDANGLVFVG